MIMLQGSRGSMLPSARMQSGLTTLISRCKQHPPQRRQIMLAVLSCWLFYIAIGSGEIIKTNHKVIHKKITRYSKALRDVEIEAITNDIFYIF